MEKWFFVLIFFGANAAVNESSQEKPRNMSLDIPNDSITPSSGPNLLLKRRNRKGGQISVSGPPKGPNSISKPPNKNVPEAKEEVID